MKRHTLATTSVTLPRTDYARILVDALEAASIPFTALRGAKHWKVRAELAGHSKTFTLACTPGAHNRAAENYRAQVRREVKRLLELAKGGLPA